MAVVHTKARTAIIFSCAHATPDVSNDRFKWLGELLYDVRPDYLIDLGDFDDMRSLCTYDDKRPNIVVSQNYEQDINHGQEARDLIRHKIRKMKVKRPYFIGLEGNHENRIKKALEYDPRLAGEKYGVSFKHLQTNHWYDEYYEYSNSAPAIFDLDGISYAHFIASGNSGSAMYGEYHASGLLKKRFRSTTVGHSHKRDIYFKDDAYPYPAIGLVAGCFKGEEDTWAGQANHDWWKGVIIKRNIRHGSYDPEFISLSRLEEAYGNV